MYQKTPGNQTKLHIWTQNRIAVCILYVSENISQNSSAVRIVLQTIKCIPCIDLQATNVSFLLWPWCWWSPIFWYFSFGKSLLCEHITGWITVCLHILQLIFVIFILQPMFFNYISQPKEIVDNNVLEGGGSVNL